MLHVLCLPTPFKYLSFAPDNPQKRAPKEVLKPGALYVECAVAPICIPKQLWHLQQRKRQIVAEMEKPQVVVRYNSLVFIVCYSHIVVHSLVFFSISIHKFIFHHCLNDCINLWTCRFLPYPSTCLKLTPVSMINPKPECHPLTYWVCYIGIQSAI